MLFEFVGRRPGVRMREGYNKLVAWGGREGWSGHGDRNKKRRTRLAKFHKDNGTRYDSSTAFTDLQ